MILFRYITRELYLTFITVTLVVIAIFTTNQLVVYLGRAASGYLTVGAVLKIMSLEIPMLFAYLMPLGFYMSTILVLGRLYMSSEITVMQACGVSQLRLFSMVMTLALALAAVTFFMMFYVDPVVESAQNYQAAHAAEEMTIKKIIPGQFKDFGKGQVFYSESANKTRSHLGGVFMTQRHPVTIKGKTQMRWDVTVARSAGEDYPLHGGRPYLLFHQGYRYRGIPGQHKLSTSAYTDYRLRIPEPSSTINVWPQNASLSELLVAAKINTKAAAILHWRFGLPISVIIFAIMSFPLSKVNPRQGKLSKLLPAIILYAIYVIFMFMGRSWLGSGRLTNAQGMWAIHAVALIVALALCCYHYKWWRILTWRKARCY